MSEANKTKYINEEIEYIREWIKKVKFKKKFLGGLDEKDVWKKIEELNDLYEKAFLIEYSKNHKEIIGNHQDFSDDRKRGDSDG